jgi:bifunctional UDP-N-acetylglucosamine pyrophosphorylase/glucosamine-1-phosphate N-acetyltransferase
LEAVTAEAEAVGSAAAEVATNSHKKSLDHEGFFVFSFFHYSRDVMEIVILAAGHGKRMGGELPKVLIELEGRPLISYLLDAIEKADIAPPPVIVVGQKREMVRGALGSEYRYVVQQEQLGTGHAVLQTENTLKDTENIMVLYGDHPLLSPATIRKLADTHRSSGATLTMATTIIKDFEDWRAGFLNFGRIIRDDKGNIAKIVERKDASDGELIVREVNPAYFCFKASWLWRQLKKLNNENVQHEYYLVDLVQHAIKEGAPVATVPIAPIEALGANTKAELELISKTLREIHR